ncbi:MAG: DUF2807 domain-containing protein [Pyrinomonadaceae bacterium]|nr:DUF2807 domain-containing protein [Sphingobacteriaceae bacterium]
MKKLLASFGWILLLLPLISVAGTKTILNTLQTAVLNEETRQVSEFRGITSSGSFDVFVNMGQTETLRIEGNAEDIEKVETKIEKGNLIIRYKGNSSGWGISIRNKIKIYITAKSLNHLAVSGSGDMEVSGPIRSEKLNAAVSGSGSISLNIIASNFNAAVSGSGEIKASGRAKSTSIAISGSGEFEGRDLKTDNANVKVSGSGEASVHADETLNASVSGSGEISYSGNARVNQSKSGSGSISKE